MRLPLFAAVIMATAFGCRTAAPADICQNPLATDLSPEEEEVMKRLPDPDKALATHDIWTDVLWGGILDRDSLPSVSAAWNKYLAVTGDSNTAVDARALTLVWRPYIKAFAAHEQAIEACKPRAEDYDSSWVANMRKQFGGELKRHAKTLRVALADLHERVAAKCTGASEGELLIAELKYRAVLEEQLRDWAKFVDSTPALTAKQKAALAHRVAVLVRALHKVSAARVMLDGVEAMQARFEAQAEELPSDMVSALNRQPALSKPFSFTRAMEDLNKILE